MVHADGPRPVHSHRGQLQAPPRVQILESSPNSLRHFLHSFIHSPYRGYSGPGPLSLNASRIIISPSRCFPVIIF